MLLRGTECDRCHREVSFRTLHLLLFDLLGVFLQQGCHCYRVANDTGSILEVLVLTVVPLTVSHLAGTRNSTDICFNPPNVLHYFPGMYEIDAIRDGIREVGLVWDGMRSFGLMCVSLF
jgi:hypothetical protein